MVRILETDAVCNSNDMVLIVVYAWNVFSRYDLFLTPPFGALHAPLFRQPLYDQHLFIEEFANQLNFQKLAPSQRLAFSEPRIPVNITFSVELAPANPDASHIETEIFELAECARRQDANKAAPIVMFALYQGTILVVSSLVYTMGSRSLIDLPL